MKKILLILNLFASPAFAVNAITSYVQISTGPTQSGGPNTQTAVVTTGLSVPYIGPGVQCLRSVNGAVSGTGLDCGSPTLSGSSNTIVASPQYQIPFYSATGTTNTLTGGSGFSWYGSSVQVTGVSVDSGTLYMQTGNMIAFQSKANNSFSQISNPGGSTQQQLQLLAPDGISINSSPAPGNADLAVYAGTGQTYGRFAVVGSSLNAAATYSGFTSTNNVTQGVLWSLPKADGTSGQALVTDGSTHLSFTTISGGGGGGTGSGTVSPAPQFQVPYYSVAGTTTTVSGASGVTVNAAGNILTATSGLASVNLTATGATVLSGSTTISSINTPVPINQPTSGGPVTSELDFTQTGNTTSGASIQKEWFANALPNTFNYPLILTSSAGTTSSTLSLDSRGSVGVNGLQVQTTFYVSGNAQIGSGAVASGASLAPVDGLYVKGASIFNSTVTINGASGNLSFTKNGDVNNYQVVGSSTSVAAGQCAQFTSSDTIVGTSCGAAGSFINNQSTLQAGAQINVASGTFNGPVALMSSVIPPTYYSGIENPLLYVSQQSAIGLLPGAQTAAIFADFLDTGTLTNPLNDGVGVHSRSRQFQGSNGQLISLLSDTQCQGANGPPCIAGQFVPGWISDLPGGTNEIVEGVLIAPRITNLAGTVMLSTGSLMGLHIPDYSNGKGAPGQNWVIYADNPYPSFFNGPISIGQTLPVAQFEVDASSVNAYAMIIGTTPFGSFNAPMPASNYIFTVSTSGVITSAGPHNFLANIDVGAGPQTASVVSVSSSTANPTGLLSLRSGPNYDVVTIGRQGADYTYGVANGANFFTDALAGDVVQRVETSTSSYRIGVGAGTSAFNVNNSSANFNESILINNAQGSLNIGNGQPDRSGVNLQVTPVSGTGFAGGLLGYNLGWNVALSSYFIGNDFGTDYFGMMMERGGDVAFSGSNNTASNTFLTHAQVMANNKLYIKGTTGLLGVNMGATIPSLAGFQVASSTTVAFAMGVSTSATGPFNFYVSTSGVEGFEDRASSGSLSSCGTSPSFIGGPNGLTITAGTASTGCTYTFPAGTFTKTPICMASPESFSVTNAFSYSTTATAITVTETGLGTGKVDIICSGRD